MWMKLWWNGVKDEEQPSSSFSLTITILKRLRATLTSLLLSTVMFTASYLYAEVLFPYKTRPWRWLCYRWASREDLSLLSVSVTFTSNSRFRQFTQAPFMSYPDSLLMNYLLQSIDFYYSFLFTVFHWQATIMGPVSNFDTTRWPTSYPQSESPTITRAKGN